MRHLSTLAASLACVSVLLGSLMVAALIVGAPGQAAPLDRAAAESGRPVAPR